MGASFYAPEADACFRKVFDPAIWSLLEDDGQPRLVHAAWPKRTIQQTAGRGLAPDWSADNALTTIGALTFEVISIHHLGSLQYVNCCTGAFEDCYAGLQVGSENETPECLEAGYTVLATFRVIPAR